MVLDTKIEVDMETQVEYINWLREGSVFITQADPMLILNSVNKKIDNISISYQTDQPVNQIIVFYTLTDGEIFSTENMVLKENPNLEKQVININKNVCGIRIDIGEEAGRKFTDLQITLNEPEFDIRMSRIVTILAIYYTATFLLSLQRPRVYDIDGDAE